VADWTKDIDASAYGASNRVWAGMRINPAVFFPTVLIALAVIVYSLLDPQGSAALFDGMRGGVVSRFDGFLMTTGNFLLLFCLLLIVSPLGRIRLGGKDARPDYSRLSWFSMLFGAGMGIGLVFYAVGEPVTHYASSMAGGAAAPLGGAAGQPGVARDLAMAATIFDWGLHPWAIYAVVGLALAVFSYDFKMPFTLRSAFYPLLGKRVWGRAGDLIDVVAILATIFGLATSLGLGAQQAMAGISWLYGIPPSALAILALIGIMTVVTFLSVRGGIDRGIRILSEANMWIAFVLMLFVLLLGPTLKLLAALGTNTLDYLRYLPALSSPVGREDTGFYHDWTVYYWAWWISWAPFVGMFMARISLGRTVREFLIGALFAPTALGIVWLTIFGESAIFHIAAGDAGSIAKATIDTQLYALLGQLPISAVTSFVAVCLVLIFFITGWDSGTLVIDCMAAGGETATPLKQKVVWLLAVGAIGVVLLLSGGLNSLQAGAIATGLPLAVLLLFLCWGALKGLLALHRGQSFPVAPDVAAPTSAT
jgi:betaine/carnitine transporter, BCCT family